MNDTQSTQPALVLRDVERGLGVLTLNRPKAINALNDEMVNLALTAVNAWRDQPQVRGVWIEGAGDRGLCAGGDVRALRDAVLTDEVALAMSFWAHEYALNYAIATYPKPYVAWMDGIVMGGGVGVSAHGAHRLVTERTSLAMPETIIGFFPDVGCLWFLAKAPGQLGLHTALTGKPVNAGDAVLLGMADRIVPSESKEEIKASLQTALNDDADGNRRWDLDSLPSVEVTPSLVQQQSWIDECYVGDDAAAIIERLRAHQNPAAVEAGEVIASRSPFSIAITLEAFRRAASMNLRQVLDQDRVLGRAFIKHPDFLEGVRAQVVDKDRNPQWQRDDVSQVDREEVLAAFR